MSHLDDEVIAAAAIGERLVDADATHLASCTTCSASVRGLEDMVARLRTVGPQDSLLVPPARVWDAITAEIVSDEAEERARVIRADAPSAADEGGGAIATVTPIRRFSVLRMVATAAVGVVIGGVGVGLWATRAADDLTVVASASLTNLVTEDAAGTAQVERRPDGSEVLVLNTQYEAVADGDQEVWLIDPNIEGMVSLGFLTASHGEFVIPKGYSTSAYPIVDISIEPRDGVPTHSGDSITRGVLGL